MPPPKGCGWPAEAMETWFLAAGIALTLFALGAVVRHDWLRLTRPMVRVLATVSGHRESWDNSARSYAAIYTFTTEGGRHEVEDALHSSFRKPELGALVELSHPAGRPDLARPPRPLMWLAVYALLLFLLGLLAAKALGWLE
jgi:hypothetical protein